MRAVIYPTPEAVLSQAGGWLASVGAPMRARILALGEGIGLPAGTMLFARGDAPDGLYAVLEGAIEIGAVDAEGHVAVLTVAEPATWFGEIALFDGLPRTHDATALVDSVVLRVPQAGLQEFLADHPANWRELGLLLTEKLRLSFRVAESTALQPASQRLAARLLMIAEGYGGASQPQRTIRLSQERLAMMLGLSRQTTNQALKLLEGDGVIALRQGCVVVNDLAGLRAASG